MFQIHTVTVLVSFHHFSFYSISNHFFIYHFQFLFNCLLIYLRVIPFFNNLFAFIICPLLLSTLVSNSDWLLSFVFVAPSFYPYHFLFHSLSFLLFFLYHISLILLLYNKSFLSDVYLEIFCHTGDSKNPHSKKK